MFNTQRRLLSQNFLHSRSLVEKIVGIASLGKKDLVLEIGPGKGILTQTLVQRAGHVIAVELDTGCYLDLKQQFSTTRNLTLYHDDILTWKLPGLPYKVVANIPFAIEGRVLRKLLDAPKPPVDCFLVLRKDFATRLLPGLRSTMFSLSYCPWFDFSIVYHFQSHDFIPRPNVEIVFFRFCQKTQPLLPISEKRQYQKFIERGFSHGPSVYTSLCRFYGRTLIQQAFQSQSLARHTHPTDLSLKQWICLYIFIRERQ